MPSMVVMDLSFPRLVPLRMAKPLVLELKAPSKGLVLVVHLLWHSILSVLDKSKARLVLPLRSRLRSRLRHSRDPPLARLQFSPSSDLVPIAHRRRHRTQIALASLIMRLNSLVALLPLHLVAHRPVNQVRLASLLLV